MIDEGSITYPNINRTINNYQPANEILNAFLVAILTTILTYQLAAIIFDIALGLKSPGQATASDISTLILTEDASLLTIMASLNISRTITRWKFLGFKSSRDAHSQMEHRRVRIPARVLFKFFVLLIAAPFASTLAVLITIERDFPVTFRDVSFGGLAFGLNEDLSTPVTGTSNEICVRYNTTLSRLESPEAEFFTCFEASHVQNEHSGLIVRDGTFRMSYGQSATSQVLRVPQEAVLVEFHAEPDIVSLVMHSDVRTNTGVFRVKRSINTAYARRLFENGARAAAAACGIGSLAEEPLNITEELGDEGSRSFTWTFIGCIFDEKGIMRLLNSEMIRFTLVESTEFNLLNVETQESLKGDNLEFLTRRRSFATFAVLGITSLAVVALRIIIRIFTNNDVHLGIEVVLKDALRINRCDSMLQNNRRVDYSAQVYEGLDDRGNSLTLSDLDESRTLDGAVNQMDGVQH